MSISTNNNINNVIFTDSNFDSSKRSEAKEISYKGNKATVLDGTFDLKNRVKNLNDYKSDLQEAKSNKGRLKRAGITLFVVAVIAAAVASMVFGGGIGLAAGALTLSFFMLASDMFLFDRLGFGLDGYANFLFPISMPILFTYYMATYESNRVQKVENSQKETRKIAEYVTNKKESIQTWLQDRESEVKKQIDETKEKLNGGYTDDSLQTISNELRKLGYELQKIHELMQNLDDSHTTAQTLLN